MIISIDLAKLLILFCLLLFDIRPVAASGYEMISDGPKSTLYIERDSVDRFSKNGLLVVSVNIMIDMKIGFPTPEGIARSAVVYGFFDCSSYRHIITATTYFSG